MTPEQRAELREWYRMATDSGDSPRSRAQAQAELWNRLTCEGWQRPTAQIRIGEGVLPKLLEMAERCADYDRRLGAVMPADFKDWHQNSPKEWPEVAAGVVTNLRKREDWAHEQMARAQGERDSLESQCDYYKADLDAIRAMVPNVEGVFTQDLVREHVAKIHRVLVAARGLMQCPKCPGPCDDPTVHAELEEALRALDDKEQRT